MKILILFATFTAVVSAFLDNVTTVLLVVPITMFVAQMLKVDPFPFLISEVLASNIGGTATLIGDPPNILIGSALNLSFMDFIMNDMPIIVIVFAVFILTIWLLFRKSIKTTQENKERICALDDTLILKDKTFLIKCLIVLAAVIFLFLTHSIIDIQPAAVAMMGAAVLMLITKQDVGEVLKTVEWETIFFFIGLFILVGSLVETGFITMLAERVIKLTHGNVLWTTTFILWMSAFLSAFVDNIPYVATMLPLIKHLNHVAPAFMANGLANNPLIWALSLGACLGGNGTIIGASANVITFGMVQKEGIKVSFMKFLIYGLPIMIESILICHLYIYLRYIH